MSERVSERVSESLLTDRRMMSNSICGILFVGGFYLWEDSICGVVFVKYMNKIDHWAVWMRYTHLVLHACNRFQAWIGRLHRTHVFEEAASVEGVDSRSCCRAEASVAAATATETSSVGGGEGDDDDDAFPARSVPAQSIMVDAKAALRSASCGEKAML